MTKSDKPFHIVRDGDASALQGAVVAIGNFDGVHRGHRAVIAAALGQKAEAVQLLKTATEKGVRWGTRVHMEKEFLSLRGYPAFDQLVTPKG